MMRLDLTTYSPVSEPCAVPGESYSDAILKLVEVKGVTQ